MPIKLLATLAILLGACIDDTPEVEIVPDQAEPTDRPADPSSDDYVPPTCDQIVDTEGPRVHACDPGACELE